MKSSTLNSRISVIIPMYNGAQFIASALQSVADQGYPDVEIIIIDDGSTDNGLDIVNALSHDVQVITQPNQGPAAARNTGLKHATGGIIAFLDADDLYPTDKFAIQMQKFSEDPNLQLVAGRIQYIFMEGHEDKEIVFESEEQTMVHVHLGSILAKREVFDIVGPFESSLRFSEDIEWWFRVREHRIEYVVMPDITLQYRLHDQNMTRGLQGIEGDFMRALHMSLQRRRATGNMTLGKISDRDLKET